SDLIEYPSVLLTLRLGVLAGDNPESAKSNLGQRRKRMGEFTAEALRSRREEFFPLGNIPNSAYSVLLSLIFCAACAIFRKAHGGGAEDAE
ncbi:MAG TPA: hypothetical protein VFS84_06115, partial [Candidatus Binatia bacterium]|nr:hypothetical protein [Candidatus Binatia bacterium]